MAPLSEVGLSLLRVDVLRILQDAEDHQARLNRALAELDRQPAKLFYLEAEVAAIIAAHDAELAKLKKPEGRKYYWSRDGVMSPRAAESPTEAWAPPKPAQRMEDDPKNALGCILLALGDERITPDNLQNFLSDLMTVFNVSVTSAAVAWVDLWGRTTRKRKKAKLAAGPREASLSSWRRLSKF